MSRREVVVGGDRVVVAARLLLAAPHDERPEHVGRVERLGRARDARRRVAPPGGREGGGEAEAKRGVSGLLLGLSEESRNVGGRDGGGRSEEHTSELQSRLHLVCRLLLEKKKKKINQCTP